MNIPLQITVQTAQLVDLSQEKQTEEPPTRTDPGARGILTKQTRMSFFKDPRTGITLKASLRKPAGNSIVAPNFKFETLGIGGLDTEFQAIFRKAFASRLFPPGLVERMGIMHVKGILLYGPPGTGKTLIARQIGKMLNAREPKVINGPEVLNKYVGQSEENIRKLFADAEKEYKERGAESELHIIIFDELDAVCKQRGSGGGGGTGVGDSVVNQLLSKLDGVDQLDNILLIGMTNRKDMIDEALLRAGRLEMHLEIGLPDEHGRVQILNIHTAQMKSNGFMDADVNIPELARLTKNFSGAEISGLVRAASSFAFSRHIKVGTMASISDDVTDIKVKMQDFRAALEETKPLFGVSEEELTNCISRGIIPYSNSIASIMDLGRTDVSTVRDGVSQSLVTLLHGPPGSGKTALAARLAIDSEFPYIKLVTPHDMIGMSEATKVSQLDKVFRDADKSPLSIVVIDNIEGLLDWVPIGPRFSNTVLSALKNVLSSEPPKGRRRLVFCTTSERSALANMQLIRYFSGQIAIPNVNSLDELVSVLRQTGTFADRDIQRVRMGLSETIGGEDIGVGIKAVLIALERSRQSSDPPERFLDLVGEAIAQRDSL
jgi:vesicle-fusing ATPase